jgi:hypothetical protein
MSLLHERLHSKRTCFETLESQFSGKFERVLFRRLPQRATPIGFDDIVMYGFEAKLASHLVNKRQASDRDRFGPAIIANR